MLWVQTSNIHYARYKKEKDRRIPIHIQDKKQSKLDKCTSDCFIAPLVITVKKDDSIKLVLDAQPFKIRRPKNGRN